MITKSRDFYSNSRMLVLKIYLQIFKIDRSIDFANKICVKSVIDSDNCNGICGYDKRIKELAVTQ